MKRKWQKISVTLLFLVQASILLLAGGILGMKNEQARLKRQQQEEVTTAIAVVNLDEGIWEEGKRIYYSSEL